eukprot:GHVN01032322.1.p1 GENE.GHVN01032322.1~~GHVN01032322.1.p1  ORF type:complete len:117 (-),score=25.51 GHVN01032322.1:78-428(-)
MSLFASDITDDDFKNLEDTSKGDEITDALGSGNQETLKEYFKEFKGKRLMSLSASDITDDDFKNLEETSKGDEIRCVGVGQPRDAQRVLQGCVGIQGIYSEVCTKGTPHNPPCLSH